MGWHFKIPNLWNEIHQLVLRCRQISRSSGFSGSFLLHSSLANESCFLPWESYPWAKALFIDSVRLIHWRRKKMDMEAEFHLGSIHRRQAGSLCFLIFTHGFLPTMSCSSPIFSYPGSFFSLLTFFSCPFSSVPTMMVLNIIGTILNQLELFPKQVESADSRNLKIQQDMWIPLDFSSPFNHKLDLVQLTGECCLFS